MGKERVAHQENLAQIYVQRQTRTSTFISLLSDWERRVLGKFLRGKFIWRVLPAKSIQPTFGTLPLPDPVTRNVNALSPGKGHPRAIPAPAVRSSAATRALACALRLSPRFRLNCYLDSRTLLSSADYNRTHPPWRHAGIRLRRLVRCLSNAGVSQGLALGVNRIHISDYFLACLVSPWGWLRCYCRLRSKT